MYRRILVPLDGSDRAEHAIAHAAEIARRFAATLVLLKVLSGRADVLHLPLEGGGIAGPTPIEVADAVGEKEGSDATGYFARIQAELTDAGIPHEVVVAEGGTVEALAAAVRDQHIDLVAMTTHPRSALGRLIFGSTTDSVLHQVEVPVLLLRIEQ